MIDSIKQKFQSFFQQFFLMNDSPQRIAIGFGMGVFLGILPFTGVIAAIGIAWYFKLNKSAAILGSVLTNTWLSIVVFGVSVKLSSSMFGMDSQELQSRFSDLFKNFQWESLLDAVIWKSVGMVALGFFMVSAFFGFLSYLVVLGLLYLKKPAQ